MNTTVERTFYIRDLFWYVLKFWKWMILFLVIGGLLGGVYTYMTPAKKAAVSVKELLSKDEISKVDALYGGYDKYLEAKDLLEKYSAGYLSKIDATKVATKEMNFYLEVLNEEGELLQMDSANVLSAYQILLKSGATAEKIAEGVSGITSDDVNYLYSVANSGYILSIVVKAADESDLTKMSETVVEQLAEATETFKGTIKEHKLIPLREETYITTDASILDLQAKATSAAITTIEDYDEQMALLSDEQLKYYDSLVNQTEYKETVEVTEPTPKRQIDKKKTLLAAVAGLLLVVIVAIVRFICTKKIISVTSLKKDYGFGFCSVLFSKKRKFVLDRLIEKNLCAAEKKSNEEIVSYVSARVTDYCKKNNLNSVSLVSSALNETTYHYAINELQKNLMDQGIACQCIGNIINDKESFGKLEKSAVLLLETFGVSSFEDIEQERAICDNRENPIMGMVVLN